MGSRPYEGGRGLAEEVGQSATEAMVAVAQAMESTWAAWWAASPELGGPSYTLQ